MNATYDAPLVRRARPLLGTLVEVGVDRNAAGAAGAAFDAVARVQRRMSRFDATSDIGRFNALPGAGTVAVDAWTAEVLGAAAALRQAGGEAFDITQGSGPEAWHCEGERLHKRHGAVRIDLGGIAKGYAVDRAVDALRAAGAACGWVNAGGDLRVFGALALPVALRDEQRGGVRPWGRLTEGALATSRFGAGSRSRHARGANAHVSVLAPLCLWADALTKVVAAPADAADEAALLQRFGACAWRH